MGLRERQIKVYQKHFTKKSLLTIIIIIRLVMHIYPPYWVLRRKIYESMYDYFILSLFTMTVCHLI